MYTLFSQSTTSALKSIRQNEAMIKKVYVPKYLYPLANICFNYILFLISLVVLAVVALVLGVFPTWRTLLAIVPLLNLFLLSIGAGMILATNRRVFPGYGISVERCVDADYVYLCDFLLPKEDFE